MEKLVITFLIQIITSFSMLGIIWFVQLIHYPLLNKIKQGFTQYERSHIKRAACFIGPLLVIDFITSILLVAFEETSALTRLATANLVFNAVFWVWTFIYQMPQHQKLAIGFSKKTVDKLVLTNWFRAFIWTLKAATLIWMIYIHSR